MATLAHWKRRVKDDLLIDPAVQHGVSLESVETLCHQVGHRWRNSFWCPHITLLTFLLQVLDGAKTLRSAVALLLVHAPHAVKPNCRRAIRLPIARRASVCRRRW